MKITDALDYIRQQQPGQFRSPKDRKELFAHVGGKKLISRWEQEERSAYVRNKKAVAWRKEIIESLVPKLFDPDGGIKVDTQKTDETRNDEKRRLQYDKTGKAQVETKKNTLVDQLA
jgi:hypothetical protein